MGINVAKRKMGNRTGNNLFGTKTNTMANTFCKALVQAGKIGLTRYDVRHARWNPKKYHFNETMERLVTEGFARYEEGGERMCVTDLGMKEAKQLSENEW